MNFKQLLVAHLEENGMHNPEAVNCVADFIAEEERTDSPMRGRWNSSVSGYPQQIANVMINTLRPFAFEWIGKYQPRAWYRAVFAPEAQTLQGEELNEFVASFIAKQNAGDKNG